MGRNFPYTIIGLALLWLFISPRLKAAGDECVIIIQGVKIQADENFNKDTDALVSAMSQFPGGAKVTAIRPTGENSQLPAGNPAHTETRYDSKASLLAQLKAALCDNDCKNVAIFFVGHGMGGEGQQVTPPENDTDGGMKVGSGSLIPNDFLLAKDMAALIDSCQKSVKLIPSTCFSEAMVKGIREALYNKHLVGVGISASRWNEPSISINDYSEFLKELLKDYYLIIGNPNLMKELKKKADELKKKNDEINKKIKAKNDSIASKIADCEKILKELQKEVAALDQAIQEAKAQKEAADKIKQLLNERKTLEQEYNDANRKDKREAKKKLDDNAKALKELGLKKIPSGGSLQKRLEKIDDEIANQDTIIADLNEKIEDLNEAWKAKRNAAIDKEAEIEKLRTLPMALISVHDPLMEVILHEAFKSAKANTKDSHPTEPISPIVQNISAAPNAPLSQYKVNDFYLYFYKVLDEDSKKCVVVGYTANSQGVPIRWLKSESCDISCQNIKFSVGEGKDKTTFEAEKNSQGKYDFRVNKDAATTSQILYHQNTLMEPGQLLEQIYYQIDFRTLREVYVTHASVILTHYDPDNQVMQVSLLKDGVPFNVSLSFLPHEEVQIQINTSQPYLESQARRYQLLTPEAQPFGELGVILRDPFVEGTAILPGILPLYMSGFLGTSSHFTASSEVSGLPLQILPPSSDTSPMQWESNGKQGLLQQDNIITPVTTEGHLTVNLNGTVEINWLTNDAFLNENEHEALLGTRILKLSPQGQIMSIFELPPQQNSFLDTQAGPFGPYRYVVLPVSQNPASCGCIEAPFVEQFGRGLLLEADGIEFPTTRLGLPESEKEVSWSQNKPNPFRTKTRIDFKLPADRPVTFRLYSVNGNQVWMTQKTYSAGHNSLVIDSRDLPVPGTYILIMQTGETTLQQKIVFMH